MSNGSLFKLFFKTKRKLKSSAFYRIWLIFLYVTQFMFVSLEKCMKVKKKMKHREIYRTFIIWTSNRVLTRCLSNSRSSQLKGSEIHWADLFLIYSLFEANVSLTKLPNFNTIPLFWKDNSFYKFFHSGFCAFPDLFCPSLWCKKYVMLSETYLIW